MRGIPTLVELCHGVEGNAGIVGPEGEDARSIPVSY